ncbi:TRAFAC clade GTPase domain-containing protein [Flavobacterium hydatis]|uniref:Double-GTPase 1 domain-containing protein n=1 Tax=Flavobacterium hydatis TaxID=991 RepID=A0A086AIT2_FLAHY|nr:hypothetical protein [Flavobacterium hydatis]KFF16596.1 hypothetical protein IW20_10540 [Flavobacterium hydatis]OXA90254.1 hypothetical protein B0A62_19470 [Flavobacterium hydatis]
MSKSILLIGKPHSSKTVFLSQFYSRLQKKKSNLKLYKAVDDLSPIFGARESLSAGEEPQTTPAEKSVKFYLPIQFSERQIDLRCPEYGGEQVLSIVENRELNKEWKTSISESNSWVLFIRLNSVNKSLDISDITFSEQHKKSTEKTLPIVEDKISDQSFFIELLQIILHSKGYDYHLINNNVKLTIVLTCWDEMNTEEKPYDILKSKLPLLLNFVESNWNSELLKIIGLSAQGFALDTPENKEKYLIEGPEEFGYLVLADGTHTKDITQLIEEAL